MSTKYNRRNWRLNRRGDVVDSRHFDSGFDFSSFNTDNSDKSSPDRRHTHSWTVWILKGFIAAAVVVVLLRYALDYVLEYGL
jgi:hypothetical protein